MTQHGITWKDKARVARKAASVGLHCVFERAFPRQPISVGDVPRSYRDITPEWLTSIFCAKVPNGKIIAVKATGGSVGTSTRQGLELTINDAASAAGVPTRVFTKGTDKFTQRMLLGLSGSIQGEADFYMKVRPHMEIEAPQGYHACLDKSSWRSMILMEDVAVSKGAKFISTDTYISRPMIEDFLANMARWHGHFWNHPSFEHDLRHLRSPIQFLRNIDSFLSISERAEKGLEGAKDVVPESLWARTDDVYAALVRSFELNLLLPKTLLHGDSHIGQTYITANGHIGIGDWSGIMQGGWAYDFAYGLTSALTVADRRAWDRDLLRYYLDRLYAAGGPKMDFDAAWLSYRQHTPYPYLCWLMTLVGASSVTPEMQPRHVSLDIVERTSHAIDDLETLKAFI